MDLMMIKEEMALVMLALARFDLQIANNFTLPFTVNVEVRKLLQDQARGLIERAGRL